MKVTYKTRRFPSLSRAEADRLLQIHRGYQCTKTTFNGKFWVFIQTIPA